MVYYNLVVPSVSCLYLYGNQTNQSLFICSGDSLSSHNGTMFSTIDKDNDQRSRFSCARNFKGAWWYKACHTANLNGEYLGGQHTNARKGIIWTAWKGVKYSPKSTKMMIKRH